jgi:hypothetical protein
VRVARRVRRAGRGNPPGAILAGRPGPTQLATAALVSRRAQHTCLRTEHGAAAVYPPASYSWGNAIITHRDQ